MSHLDAILDITSNQEALHFLCSAEIQGRQDMLDRFRNNLKREIDAASTDEGLRTIPHVPALNLSNPQTFYICF